MQRIQKGKFIMKKAISVLMIAACMLCMVTACEKKDKKENDTSAAQATETDCTAAERVTTEPEGEITISEMIDQRIKEEGKIMIYRMHFGPSKTPLEITEDLNVNIISYDGKELIDYGNSSNRRGETRLGDIIHNKVDYSTYNIGAYGGNWKRHRYVSGGDEKYVEEEGYVQREITTDDSGNNTQMETLYSYSKGTLYTREEGSEVWNQTEKEDSLDIVSFGTFERIKLDGKTYMTFCVRDNLNLIKYYIIPDNKFTENKTVVYDTPGSEGTTVNTVDYLKKYQAVPKEELEQMIVFPGSKKQKAHRLQIKYGMIAYAVIYKNYFKEDMKMASGQIRMTPDTMRERAGEYRTEADNVQSVIDKMDRLLETLLTEWEGSASEAYANKFAELRPSFVKGKELIDDIAAAFDKTAEAVESTDTQIANQFSM